MRLEFCFLGNERFNVSSRKSFVLCASEGRFPLYYVRTGIHQSFPLSPKQLAAKNSKAGVVHASRPRFLPRDLARFAREGTFCVRFQPN